jgi:hypothetical protein
MGGPRSYCNVLLFGLPLLLLQAVKGWSPLSPPSLPPFREQTSWIRGGRCSVPRQCGAASTHRQRYYTGYCRGQRYSNTAAVATAARKMFKKRQAEAGLWQSMTSNPLRELFSWTPWRKPFIGKRWRWSSWNRSAEN